MSVTTDAPSLQEPVSSTDLMARQEALAAEGRLIALNTAIIKRDNDRTEALVAISNQSSKLMVSATR